MRGQNLFAMLILCTSLLAAVACSPPEEEAGDPSIEAWATVEELRPQLEAKRAELAEAQAELDAMGDEAAAEAEEAAEGAEDAVVQTREELEAEVGELAEETAELSEEYYESLFAYLNTQTILEGAELTPEQRAVFDYKAEEDILIAQEYIREGGDYSRAIDIYDQALISDPTNERLLAAKAEAEELRYMSEERFSAVEKGMTEEQVLDLLGPIKKANIKEFPERARLGYFYPRERSAAAGVYFKKNRQGEWIVETTDFEAVKARGGEEDEADAEG